MKKELAEERAVCKRQKKELDLWWVHNFYLGDSWFLTFHNLRKAKIPEKAKRRPSIAEILIPSTSSKKPRSDSDGDSSSSQDSKIFKSKSKSKTNGKENSDNQASEKFLSSRLDREDLNKSSSSAKLLQPKISDAIKSSRGLVEKSKTSKSPQPSKRVHPLTDPDATFCEPAEKRKSDYKMPQPSCRSRRPSTSVYRTKTDPSNLFQFNGLDVERKEIKLLASKSVRLPTAQDLDETPNLSEILNIKKEKLSQPKKKVAELPLNDNSIQDIFESSSSDSVLCVGTQNDEILQIEDSAEILMNEAEAQFLNIPEHDSLAQSLKPQPSKKKVYKECSDCTNVRNFWVNFQKLKKTFFFSITKPIRTRLT